MIGTFTQQPDGSWIFTLTATSVNLTGIDIEKCWSMARLLGLQMGLKSTSIKLTNVPYIVPPSK